MYESHAYFAKKCSTSTNLLIETSSNSNFSILDKQEWLETNPTAFCTQQRKLVSLLSTKINKYEVDLNRSYSSVLLTLKFNATHVRKIKNECKFTISADKFDANAGIYLNILKMRLRQQKYSEKCVDSLQIKYNGNIKEQVCGNISNGKIKSYEDLTGKMKVTLNIDSGLALQRDDDFLEIQLVATAFKYCDKSDREFNCKPFNARSCIDARYRNDSIVNCIEPFCNDEPLLGCSSSSVFMTDTFDESSANENIIQIFLSATVSLILTMLSCGALIWMVYKLRRCISPPPTRTPSQTNRRRRRNNTEVVSTADSPSAPPLAVDERHKNDLPPSYSELFPEQSGARKDDAENS